MIVASCRQCAAKLKVKVELAGKKVRCPRCQAAVSVPAGDEIIADSAAGDASSQFANDSLEAASRYRLEAEIARGGMGAILRAVDQDIHREVAVKFLLNHADERQKARFFDEAQITGQLEHPNIVPIHQLGVHPDGRCFFSMKMVKGRSLAAILKEERADDTLGRLLGIFVNICNALSYAHSRSVIHRDLKPANIMVGDFGEVYVMDWGLAKVVGQAEPAGSSTAIKATLAKIPAGSTAILSASGSGASGSGASGSGEKVTTHRSVDGELTQDGSILGTPAYMPPEQARGDAREIDQRSDIYSLGAILYEIMTRTPPPGRGGEMVELLMRVAEGKIDRPEVRAPERVKSGWVPAELSAVAMKALARRPSDRYASVEDLRKDIERFLEGRSVSAKTDTMREMIVKLVKRNKGASIATLAGAVLLAVVGSWSLIAILRANADTRKALDDFVKERDDKREQAKASLPSLVKAAQLLINQQQFDDALKQLQAVLEIDADYPPGRLLKGHVLIARQDFPAAADELRAYLKLEAKAEHADVARLLSLTENARPGDLGTLRPLSIELNRQKAFAIAQPVAHAVEVMLKSREEVRDLYRARLESAWPGSGERLTLDNNGDFALDLFSADIVDLSPLRGIPVKSLNLGGCRKLRDLTPLAGMPIVVLNLSDSPNIMDLTPLANSSIQTLLIGNTGVTDLGPVRTMPIVDLRIGGCNIRDLSPLAGKKLKFLSAPGCPATDLTPLKGMPLESLNLFRSAAKDLAPLAGMPLVDLEITEGCQSSDLSPLRGMRLRSFAVSGTDLVDLSPLKGMPLESLTFYQCNNLRDLEPLRGAPLKFLSINSQRVDDLSPLEGMPLEIFRCNGAPIKDLSPLRKSPLIELQVHGPVKNLSPLAGLKLKTLNLQYCPISDLSPLKGMPLDVLSLQDCPEPLDLRPLDGMKLKQFFFPKNPTGGIDVIRSMTSLTHIDGGPADLYWKKEK